MYALQANAFEEFSSSFKNGGLKLEKGSIDHNLYDDQNNLACCIKISHGKRSKSNEVVAHSIKKTENEFKKRGLS